MQTMKAKLKQKAEFFWAYEWQHIPNYETHKRSSKWNKSGQGLKINEIEQARI